MSQRIGFANQLRGLAALAVAVSHLVGVFWILPDVVSAVTFSPPQPGPPPGPLLAVVAYPWFNFGPFGVAVFFLISGLVIPFSFQTHGRRGFAVARLLRIYPTYVIAFLLQMLVLYGASLAWGRPFGFTLRAIVTNALLVYDLVGEPSLDLVNWTLSVELKFYLLALLLQPALVAGRTVPLLGAGAALLAVNGAMALGWVGDLAAPPSTPSYTASSHSTCLIFMLIGVAFNFHSRGRLGAAGLLATAGVLVIAFLGSWRLGVWAGQYPVVSSNYLYALALFAALYAIRRWLPAVPGLDAMASISFPFYVVHSLLGYSMLRALMVALELGYTAALPITLLVLVAVSTMLHILVERPTARAGKAIFRLREPRLREY